MAAESKERAGIVTGADQIPPGTHLVEAHNWCEAADREGANEAHDSARTFAAVAQAHASLAIAERLGELKDALYDCLGDGSNLDRIKQAAEEMAAGQ